MIPDLGKHAAPILSSYLASFVLLALLILLSWRRYRNTRRQLENLEKETKNNG